MHVLRVDVRVPRCVCLYECILCIMLHIAHLAHLAHLVWLVHLTNLVWLVRLASSNLIILLFCAV